MPTSSNTPDDIVWEGDTPSTTTVPNDIVWEGSNGQSGNQPPIGGLGGAALARTFEGALGMVDAATGLKIDPQSAVAGMGFNRDTGSSAGNIAAASLGALPYGADPAAIVPSLMSGGASEVAGQMGAGPLGQAAAGVAGALSPTGWKMLWQKLLQVDPANAAQNLQRILQATGGKGMPTLGQLAGPDTNAQALESLIGKLPLAGVIRRRVAATNEQMGQNAMDIAQNLGAFGSPEEAGAAVQSDLQGYLQDLRGKRDAAYGAVPKGTNADLTQTYAAIDAELSKPGNSDVANFLRSDESVKDLLKYRDTMQPGWHEVPFPVGGKKAWVGPNGEVSFTPPMGDIKNVPYDLANNARKNMGSKVDRGYNQGDQTSIQNGALAQVNNSLTQDVGTALGNVPGGKEALARAQAAGEVYKQTAARISNVVNAKLPEDAYNAIFSGANKGSTTLASVYGGLSGATQKQLTGQLFERMGRPLPGTDEALKEGWSPQRFLTKWNTMDESAKNVIQGTLPDEYREDMDAVAQFANQMREGNKFYANPSGTAHVRTALGVLMEAGHGAGGLALGLLTGHGAGIPAAIGAASYAVTVPLSARAFTNPTVVHWLAAATRLPPSYAPVIANQLSKADPELRRALNSASFQQGPNNQAPQ